MTLDQISVVSGGHALGLAVVFEVRPYRPDNYGLDIGCRYARDASRVSLSLLHKCMGDVITVANPALVRM